MNEWSTYFQNPEFLEGSRLFMLDPEFRPLVAKWVGLKSGMRILDVGCGTGAFAFYLAEQADGCDFTGLDFDQNLIAQATKLASSKTCNTFTFTQGDALALPFAANSFDLVVSHTFLTNISNPQKALAEMRRVSRPGGVIASVTAQQLDHIPVHPGFYPDSHQHYYEEWVSLYGKILKLYEQAKPKVSFLRGANPALVPHLFAQARLWNISMHAVGISFSLSNAAMPDEDKTRYINLSAEAELKKFDAFCALPAFYGAISHTEATRYRALTALRRDALLADVGENFIWDWMGGATLLMTGVVPLL